MGANLATVLAAGSISVATILHASVNVGFESHKICEDTSLPFIFHVLYLWIRIFRQRISNLEGSSPFENTTLSST